MLRRTLSDNVTPIFSSGMTNRKGTAADGQLDWAVAFDKETKVINALLRRVGNPLLSIKANAGLTVQRKAGCAD